uniref:Uncharacterized protein n=1 Tax=Arundo donax TaxID=35708 RepID=A0A0A8ZG25_ARUDO
MDELKGLRCGVSSTWIIVGDFNLIHKVEDKNN